jgi:hypothetical protein
MGLQNKVAAKKPALSAYTLFYWEAIAPDRLLKLLPGLLEE